MLNKKIKFIVIFFILIFFMPGLCLEDLSEDFSFMNVTAESSKTCIYEVNYTSIDAQACTLKMLGNDEDISIRLSSSLSENNQMCGRKTLDYLNLNAFIFRMRRVNYQNFKKVYLGRMPKEEGIVYYQHISDGKKCL